MVWEADENPSSVSQASVSPENEYEKSVVTVAEVHTLSPLPPKSALFAGYPLTALLAMPAAVSLPEADSHL